jgi:hypothetical protein
MLCDVCEDTFGRLLASSVVLSLHHHQSSYASLTRSASDDCFICSRIEKQIKETEFSLGPHSDRPLTTWEIRRSDNVKKSPSFNVWVDSWDVPNSSQEASLDSSRFFKSFDTRGIIPRDPWDSDDDELERLPIALSGHTGSDETISQIIEWVKRCTKTHYLCNEGREEMWMPTRLLEISNVSGDLSVHLRDHSQLQCSRYLTLSHCWGPTGTQNLQLTTASFNSLCSGIAVCSLKPTFQDMAHLTWQLGVRFLWIDCLCIIQDDNEDWKTESALMGKVYANSWLNVSANSRGDNSAGLFAERNGSRLQDYIQIRPKESSEAITFILTEGNTWWREVETAPVNKRAWVLQERILSPRIVHMSTTMALWECKEYQASEIFPDGGIPEQQSPNNYGQLKRLYRGSPTEDSHDVRVDWNRLLLRYTMCGLTFETDRLIALSGIASEFHKRAKCDYVAGLWSTQLPLDLLWWKSPHTGSRSGIFVAPSWSWASMGGIASLPNPRFDYTIHATILGYETTLANPADKYGQLTGGYIELRAPVETLDWIGMRGSCGHDVQSVKISVPRKSGEAEMIEKWLPISMGVSTIYFDCEEDEDLRTAYFAVVRAQTESFQDQSTARGSRLEGVLLRSRPCSRYERIGVAFLAFEKEQNIVSKMPIQDITII